MPEPQPELLAHSQTCSRTHKQRFSVAVTFAAFPDPQLNRAPRRFRLGASVGLPLRP